MKTPTFEIIGPHGERCVTNFTSESAAQETAREINEYHAAELAHLAFEQRAFSLSHGHSWLRPCYTVMTSD